MARPRTLRTMITRIGDNQLKAFWDLRCTFIGSKADYRVIRKVIIERIKELRVEPRTLPL